MRPSARFLTVAALGAFLVSAIGAEVVRRIALQRALLDAVNERSLHTVAKPRLGGTAIVAATLAGALSTWSYATTELRTLLTICAGISLLGLLDDLRPIRARVRILVQTCLAAVFLALVGTPSLFVAPGIALPIPVPATFLLMVVWIVGVLNIYNFMDGMDGLAGAQTVIASIALMFVARGEASFSLLVFLAAATLGFLVHNYPPARIFMGDAGSTFIGLAFATVAIDSMKGGVPLTQSALAIGPFLLDGSFTLIRRASRRERVWEAHRSHLYQRAVQTGLEHRDVLIVYVGWMIVASIGCIAAGRGASWVIGAWLVVIAGLLAIRAWVERRESDRAKML